MKNEEWPRIAVFGAGAVGCYFGGMLARAGAPVVLIGRPRVVQTVERDGLFLDSVTFKERVRVSVSTAAEAARDAEIVLLCVKTPDTEDAARALAPHLSAGSVVVSLQNGVDNVERIRSAIGLEAVPAVVYVAVEMTAPGHVTHSGRGDLILGRASLAAVFRRASIPCQLSENVQGELWTKLIINCAYNAISALSRARYGRLVSSPGARDLMREVMEEALAVASASGVVLTEVDLVATGLRLAESMPEATSSTAQDIARGRRTEIAALNGYVARRGRQLGIPTPINRTLYALVALLEESSLR